MGNAVGSGGEDDVESGTKRLITAAVDPGPVDALGTADDDDDECRRRRCRHHFHHRHTDCRDGRPSAPTDTETGQEAMMGAHRSASRPVITAGPSRCRVQPVSVSYPPAPLGGRRTLSPVHYAHAASDECPMLSASGPVATWCRHHIHEGPFKLATKAVASARSHPHRAFAADHHDRQQHEWQRRGRGCSLGQRATPVAVRVQPAVRRRHRVAGVRRSGRGHLAAPARADGIRAGAERVLRHGARCRGLRRCWRRREARELHAFRRRPPAAATHGRKCSRKRECPALRVRHATSGHR
ncbi:uncharacterized protein [Dermacentor albipictus]|uniref:uncharacterized protein isoform X1 n=1 Tax=Dermacentor albipictus TaxID=60249 RepID=UPI0031FDC4BB